MASELAKLYADVYSEAPYFEGPAEVENFILRFENQRTESGFSLSSYWESGQLLGYIYGFTIRRDSPWWDTAMTSLLPNVAITQLRSPTVFISELLVRIDSRRTGIGRLLHDHFLASRNEKQALLFAHPAAAAARATYAKWGWVKVGHGVPFSGAGIYEVLVLLRSPKSVGAVKENK